MSKNTFIKTVFNLPLPLEERVFMFLRYISAPFFSIEKLIPHSSKVLDVGCGHGLFELVLKNRSNNRSIIGIDPDKNKIRFANKIEGEIARTKFRHLSIFQIKEFEKKFDCIVMFDVDYLLKNEEKIKIFKKVKKLLNKNGIFILKTVVNDGSIGYYMGYLQELVTVFLFKKTLTADKKFNFLSISEYKDIFKTSGFKIKKEGQLRTIFYHPHYYFVAKK
jgi:2-polyprenyl-3-methyl-5-hydroxy-6-metoxy-1,4-benzoquinol methylase